MNKTELILSIAEETGFSRKDVEIGLNAAIHQITKALVEGEKIQIVGFGAFETKVRAERMGRNPKTGENIPIPATKIPAFKAGKALKDAVDQSNRKFGTRFAGVPNLGDCGMTRAGEAGTLMPRRIKPLAEPGVL